MIEVEAKITVYQCDHCDFQSKDKVTVKSHEREHKQSTCEHSVKYWTYFDTDDCQIEQCCIICGLSSTVKLDCSTEDVILGQIFDILVREGQSLKELSAKKLAEEQEESKRIKDFETQHGRPMNEMERRLAEGKSITGD